MDNKAPPITEKILKIKEFELMNSDSQKYKLQIIVKECSMTLNAININEKGIKFQKDFSFDKLQSEYRYFKISENTTQIFEDYFINLEEKDINFKIETNIMKIIFKIYINKKETDLEFILEKQKTNVEENLELIFSKIFELNKNLNEQNKINKELENKINEMKKESCPIGTIIMFAGKNPPENWLFCDGSAISRTEYQNLYKIIGDIYGSGDGKSTFNLPNFSDLFPQGKSNNENLGKIREAGLPEISGTFINNWRDWNGNLSLSNPTGCFHIYNDNEKKSSYPQIQPSNEGSYYHDRSWIFKASASNNIYGRSKTVQPKSILINFIIKYQ